MFSFLLVHSGSTAVRGQEGEGSRSGRALPDSAECQRVKDVSEIICVHHSSAAQAWIP